jgi:hypothetical protein
MYRFSIDYSGWDWSPEKRRQDNAIRAMVDENTPELKVVLLDIGIFLGIIAIIVTLLYGIFG